MERLKKLTALLRFIYFSQTIKGLNISRVSFIGSKVKISCLGSGMIRCKASIRMDDYSELISKGNLQIGNHFVLNKYSRVICHERIEIGNDVVIARFVSILDHDHDYSIDKNGQLFFDGYKTAPVKIGNNVWIGDKVTICKGVQLGNNVIVAANSVVTKSFPSNCIIGGVTAKIIKPL